MSETDKKFHGCFISVLFQFLFRLCWHHHSQKKSDKTRQTLHHMSGYSSVKRADKDGSVTIKIESSTNGGTLSRIRILWVGCIPRTCDLNVQYCVLFSSRVRVKIRVMIRFSVWLVSCYAHVFETLSIVSVTLQMGIGVGDGGQQGRSPPPGFRSGGGSIFPPPRFWASKIPIKRPSPLHNH